MTIDEAIKHAEIVAEANKSANCIECAEEHQQLADWLKELKALRKEKENNTIFSIPYNLGEVRYKIIDDDIVPITITEIHFEKNETKIKYEIEDGNGHLDWGLLDIQSFSNATFATREEAE